MNITNWKQKLYYFLPQMLKTSWISSKKRSDKKRFKLYVFPEIYRKLQKDPDYLMFMNDKVLWGLFDWYNYFAFIGDYNKRVEKTTEKIVIYIYICTLFPVTVCWNLQHPIKYIKNCWVRLLSNYNIKNICTIYTRLDTCLMSISRFFLTRQRNTSTIEAIFLYSGCGRVV